VLAGSKVVDSGIWPPTERPLQVELKD
jgi:hypothetical protein